MSDLKKIQDELFSERVHSQWNVAKCALEPDGFNSEESLCALAELLCDVANELNLIENRDISSYCSQTKMQLGILNCIFGKLQLRKE